LVSKVDLNTFPILLKKKNCSSQKHWKKKKKKKLIFKREVTCVPLFGDKIK